MFQSTKQVWICRLRNSRGESNFFSPSTTKVVQVPAAQDVKGASNPAPRCPSRQLALTPWVWPSATVAKKPCLRSLSSYCGFPIVTYPKRADQPRLDIIIRKQMGTVQESSLCTDGARRIWLVGAPWREQRLQDLRGRSGQLVLRKP